VKVCSKCHTELPLSGFRKLGNGYRSECRVCAGAYRAAHREETKAYYAAHREELKAYSAAYRSTHREEKAAYGAKYYAAHREDSAAYSAAYRAAHPEATAACKLQRKYGLTPADRDEILERQGGLCACGGCGNPATRIDHCHNCEDVDRRRSVRGMLCHPCNASLDHIARFSPAHAAYLAVHSAVCPSEK
jgi:hypothetical protein